MKRYAQGIKAIVTLWTMAALLSGCAGSSTSPTAPLFDEWQAKAEESRGYSPAAPAPALPETAPAPPETTPGDEAAQAELPTLPVSLTMNSAPVAAVLRALARAADQSIIISDSVTGTANISAVEIPWDTLFLGMLDTYGLVYERTDNILTIKTPEDLAKDLEKDKAELRRLALGRQLENTQGFETRIFFLQYIDATAMKEILGDLIEETTGQEAASETGIAVQQALVTVDATNNAVLVHASREKHRQMQQIIAQLDQPTLQVLIEAQIVETSQDTARALGVQWGGLNLEEGSSQLQWIGGAMPDYGGTLFSDFDTSAIADLAGNTGAVLGYQLQDLSSDYILTLQLSALQEEGKLNILSSPSITTLDNQKASIESGREVPYQTIDGDGDINIEWKKAALSLNVTPHIIDDNTLRLNVLTHKDELDFTNAVEGNPTIITKNAETNVILFNGQTMVIGGLSKETASDEESGIPVLKDIPLLGGLFRSTDKSSDMEEILIFITPHILKEKPDSADAPDNGEG